MFHFPTFPPHALCVQAWVTGHDSCRVSPFGNPRINARSAAPRGLSQPPTSFFGSWCQGIHRAPLLTWPQRCSRPLCSSQGTGGHLSESPRTPWLGCRSVAEMAGRCALPCGRSRNDKRLRTENSAPSGLNSVPTAGLDPDHRGSCGQVRCTDDAASEQAELVSIPPLSNPHETFARDGMPGRSQGTPDAP
jgi:hypothetical protein